MKKIIAIFFAIMYILSFTSCHNSENNQITSTTTPYNISDLYKVEKTDDLLFEYTVTDINANILVTDKTNKQPHINIIDNKILSVSIQGGTGLSTQTTTYYNLYTSEISQTYTYVLGEYDIKTIYVTFDDNSKVYKVIVQDIFDKNIFYHETILADVQVASDPVVEWEFTDDGIANIKYLKGNDYKKTNISISLK